MPEHPGAGDCVRTSTHSASPAESLQSAFFSGAAGCRQGRIPSTRDGPGEAPASPEQLEAGGVAGARAGPPPGTKKSLEYVLACSQQECWRPRSCGTPL